MKQTMQTLTSSRSNEWFTPSRYTEMANRVMGGLDLDPASSELANRFFVRARSYYDKEIDGLNQPWGGRIWLNPPYGSGGGYSTADIWMTKLLHEYDTRRVCHAVVLTKTVPGYKWWDSYFHGAWPGLVCVARGRISFINASWVAEDGTVTVPNGVSNISKTASSFWYIGDNEDKFKRVFGEIGKVIRTR